MKKLLSLFMIITVGFAYGQDFSGTINNYLNSNRTQLGIQSQDISDVIIDRHSYSKSMDVENVYIIQRHQGIEIFNSSSSFAVKNGQVINANLSFSSNLAQKVNTTNAAISASTAISKAAQSLGLSNPINLEILQEVSVNEMVFSNGTISLNNIPVKLVYQPTEDNKLILAWDLSIYLLDASHYYNVRIDATTGVLLEKNDWVVSCEFETENHDNNAHNNNTSVLFSQKEEMTVNTIGGAQYRVFAMPIESPSHGADALIADPSGDGDGSPFGWHDTNGAPGAEFTITRGNNVWAKDDINSNNGNDGVSADGGGGLNFDFPYDLSSSPGNMIEASTVNLFYWNNIMHDVWYQYGFDEASGNFQENNYGNPGNGSDSVNADAQDGGGTNNANFSTPPDGNNPRMQMFLWNAPNTGAIDLLTINNGPLAGVYTGVPAGFGGDIPVPPLTDDLVLIEDDDAGASTDPIDGCDNITNGGSLNGKIVVIRRGECEFGFKALAAENQGAVAVIVVNNVAGTPIVMGAGAVGDQVTIPLFMLNNIDGEAIITELLGGGNINGTINGEDVLPMIDGDLDNGIVAHEYGHGISIRLTGGSNNSNCLNNAEQMGEGWSDWFGNMLTMRAGDQPEDPRGVGTYATGQPTNGAGIRQYPYSTDMSVNPLTYGNLPATGGQVHAVGTIWATMIWDLNWALIDQYGFDADFYNGTGGNNIAMQLVIDGIKLQGCSPGFIDGRDAILEADEIANGGANRCLIWEAFANRGLGASADQGSSFSTSDGTEAFDMPTGPNCTLGTADRGSLNNNFIIYPNPSNGNINIRSLINLGDATISIFDINGREVYNNQVSLQDTVNVNAENLRTGLYIIQIKGADYTHTAKLIIN
ncbi:MAG: T9SS-dependent M36 family metallopeptidase [Flavobacteriaceae bacterium]